MKEISPYLTEKLKKLPDEPGVYMHLDEGGNIIYVGKAKNLKKRVRQYFRDNITDLKTIKLVENIRDTRWTVVDNEVEAFLLECNLIKQYRPYYNILLKDDKSYPYIKLTLGDEYPRVIMTRKRVNDGGRYFGPYSAAAAAKSTVEAINRFYPLQMCTKKTSFGKVSGKVCLNYHIGRCMGPCTGKIPKEEYSLHVQDALSILSGNFRILTEKISSAMEEESEKLNFEAAIELRDMRDAVNSLYDRQKIDSGSDDERDILAIGSDDDTAAVQIFCVRDGKMIRSDTRYLTKSSSDTDEEVMISFIQQYYLSDTYIPKEIILARETGSEELLSELLSGIRGSKVILSVPKIGEKKRLCELAEKNALMNIENLRSEKEKAELIRHRALSEISDRLGLTRIPRRIESYDISNISGSDNVGVMVVYNGTKRAPSEYRRFRIKYVDGQNDYASMSEVVFRRLNRAFEEKRDAVSAPKFLPLPDLILVDGGLTHVNTVKGVVSTFGYDIDVAGLVKDSKHRLRGIILPDGTEIRQDSFRFAGKILNDISEEVHRYAIEYHRSSRSRSMLRSELAQIEGIGAKKSQSLMDRFKNIDAIKSASVEDLRETDGITEKLAENIYRYFNS